MSMGKTKVMILGRNLHILQTASQYPCAVCRKGVGKNSIFCSGCLFWVHKKCSNIPGRLAEDPDFRCRMCVGNAWTIDGRPCVEVQLAGDKLDAVDNFVYLGDCICPGGGFELATIKRCCSACGEYLEKCCKAISLDIYGQAVSKGQCFIHQNIGPSDRKIRNNKKEHQKRTSLLSRLKLKSLD